MKKYTVKDNLGNKKTIYAKDLAHAIKLNDAETYKGFKITKIHGDWKVESPDKEMWDYDGSMSIAQVKKAIDKGLDKGIWDSKVEDNLDNDIYKALVEVSKNKNTHSSFGWNGIIEGMVENILIKNGSIDKKDRFKVRRQIQQQMKESRVQKLFNDSIKDEASLATTINALVNDEKAAIDAYNVAIKNLEGSIDDTARQVLISIRDDERRHIENLYAVLNGQVTEKNLKDSIHDSTTSDLLKTIDKLYAKYGDLDVLSNTDLDNAIKELAATLPNATYTEFKDVVEKFIGERRLRERMKRSGLTYFKR